MICMGILTPVTERRANWDLIDTGSAGVVELLLS